MMRKMVCLSLCLASLVGGQGKHNSPPSIITILTMASCRSTCKNGACRQQVGTVLPNMVKCECRPGWIGENCDGPNALEALKIFRFAPPFSISGEAINADLALIDKRVQNRDSHCADNFVCYNGGYCTGDAVMGYNCKCPVPYTGIFCRERCEKKCYNGGECFKEITSMDGSSSVDEVCKCPRQYQGEFCELKLGL